LDFKNGIFQGKISKGYKLSEKGVFIWDNSSFFAGNAANNVSFSELIFFGGLLKVNGFITIFKGRLYI